MLRIQDTLLVLIDVQGKLAQIVDDRDRVYHNIKILLRAAKTLGIPVIWTEQNPARMGRTVREIAGLLDDQGCISKMSFSCWGEPRFAEAVAASGRRQLVLTGIETHVCVFQTARDLRAQGYEICIPRDAVSSRTADNRQVGLDLMRTAGAVITSVEAMLFELLGSAEHPAFRDILALVK
jgi:nicotinamidase-related amidase